MANFNIFTTSTAAQALANGENGFVGTSGELVVSSAVAISIGGPSDLAVLGAVVALDADAVTGPAGSADISVGETGQIVSTGGDGIDLSLTGTITLQNNGLISGTSRGVTLAASDGAAGIFLANSGTIQSSSFAINAEAGTGDVTLHNSGLIETLTSSRAINFSASGAEIINSGTIIGGVAFSTASGSVLIRNTGTIIGNILNFGSGEVDLRGGVVIGVVTGGEGNNIFRIDRSDIDIADFGTTGTDTVFSSVSFDIASGIETLVLTGSADIRGFGGFGDDTLLGNRGDNRLSGGAGNDSLVGARGDDTLRGGEGNDILSADEGTDGLRGGAGSDTLLIEGNLSGVVVDLVKGTASGDITDDDLLESIENVIGGSTNDRIIGNVEANRLEGRNGDDTLLGGTGNDTLTGGLGSDSLNGGQGADSFVYLNDDPSAPTAIDVITGFLAGTDIIDLRAIDADLALGGDQAFSFGGVNFLALGQGSVRVFQDAANNRTVVELRNAQDALPDLTIHLTGLLTLTAGDFAL